MEPAAFVHSLEKLGPYGVPAIMALLFYVIVRLQNKAHGQALTTQKEAYSAAIAQNQKVLEQYENNLTRLVEQQLQAAREMRAMYDSNVRLVESTISLTQRYSERSEYLEKLIQNNIQCWQTAIQAINDNQFCPRVKELGGKT
jgi:hypothetical protein